MSKDKLRFWPERDYELLYGSKYKDVDLKILSSFGISFIYCWYLHQCNRVAHDEQLDPSVQECVLMEIVA